jgi:histidinol-phosphate phosphatase family protein
VIRQAVIVAGGKSHRLRAYGISTPKILLEVMGKTLLERYICELTKAGIERITFLLGNDADEVIREIQAAREKTSLKLDFVVEKKKLGTGGALLNSVKCLSEEFVLIFGDLYIDFNLKHYLELFDSQDSDLTLITRVSDHPSDSNLVVGDWEMKVDNIIFKNQMINSMNRNRAMTGIFLLRSSFLHGCTEKFASRDEVDFEEDIIFTQLHTKKISYLPLKGIVRDIGTPDRLNRFNSQSYKSELEILKEPKYIFLDRDGVLIEDIGYRKDVEGISINWNILEGLKRLFDCGYRFIVVTNQPVIARGEAVMSDIEAIHGTIDQLLFIAGISVEEYYVCPHHPESGFQGEVPELKVSCKCRKPQSGLLMKASTHFNICDLQTTSFIGDSWRDEEAATSVGSHFYMMENNEAGDSCASNFSEIVDQILDSSDRN